MADENLVEGLIRRRDALMSKRGLWSNHWDDLARVMVPRRLGFVTQTEEGDRRSEEIFDGTAIQASRGLANAVGAFLREDPWFFIKASGAVDGEGEEWLDDTETRLRDALDNPAARFRQAVGEADLDVVVFGTACVFIGEGATNLLFQSLHLKDALPIFNEQGQVEGVLRNHKFTVRQAMDKFEGNVSQDIKDKSENEALDDKVDFLHAVVPRSDSRPGAILSKNLPWADLWIETQAKRISARSGYNEFPFVVPRWDTSSGEDYGRSPGMVALPDANSLQAIGETLLIAGQRAADPPLAVPNDSAFDAPNTFPGGLAYYDVDTARALGGKNPFFEIGGGGNIGLTQQMQEDIRNQIWNAFFRNILRLPTDGPQMTATEINARRDEFIREVGPVFGRLETDYTAPMIERAFHIMLRGGGFRPIPEVLQGQNIRFEYQSPIKRAREQIEAVAAVQWAQSLMEMSQVKPEALDKINIDALANFTAKANNLPLEIINSDETVAALREERAQMKQQAQMMEQTQGMAGAAKDGGAAVEAIQKSIALTRDDDGRLSGATVNG